MSSQTNTAPRALVHKRILSAAAENPEASLEEIADEVAGASTPLVERVLEEYGDPAEDAADSNAMSQPDLPIDIDELSSAQRETLAAVLEQPDATQQEIATKLDVSSATVSQRLRNIEGFDWSDRGSIVAAIAESDVSITGEDGSSQTDDGSVAGSSSDDAVDESVSDDGVDESVSDDGVDGSVSDDGVDGSASDESTETPAAEPPDTPESASKESAETQSVDAKPSDQGDDGSTKPEDGRQADTEPPSAVSDPDADATASDESPLSRDDAVEATAESSRVGADDVQDIERRLTDLEETVATQRDEIESVLERGISELESDIEETITDGGQFEPQPAIQDDELLAKVIRASMADEKISEDEELQIIEALR